VRNRILQVRMPDERVAFYAVATLKFDELTLLVFLQNANSPGITPWSGTRESVLEHVDRKESRLKVLCQRQ
jgi:hypothetical protein